MTIEKILEVLHSHINQLENRLCDIACRQFYFYKKYGTSDATLLDKMNFQDQMFWNDLETEFLSLIDRKQILNHATS